MKEIIIDCSLLKTRDDFHDHLAQALAFPDWYGKNLDALHDLLTAAPEETHLVFRNWNQAEEALGPYAAGIQRTLAHAASRNFKLTVEYQ